MTKVYISYKLINIYLIAVTYKNSSKNKNKAKELIHIPLFIVKWQKSKQLIDTKIHQTFKNEAKKLIYINPL